tara:strand:+ start:4494 stop:5441 length:948 start_codon:yes stop_codon:yes gene_type:complete
VINIAIIGLGNIGYRHFQSLTNHKKKINFYLIDNNYSKISLLKKKINKSIHNYQFYTNVENLKLKFYLVIIATNSNSRLPITKKLITTNNIKYIIYEKIVSSKVNDYKKIISLVNKKKIKAFVNFPRREYDLFNYIKNKIYKNSNLLLYINYKKINLASNLIHYLDLFQFFKKTKNLKLIYQKLDKRIYKSKRTDFIEFKGKIAFSNNFNDYIFIDEHKKNLDFFLIKIDSNIFVIFEDQNIYIEIDLTKGTIIKKKYKNYLQSELTLKYLQKLISNKKIKLTKLEEALFTHKPLINTFNNHLKLISNNRKLSIT